MKVKQVQTRRVDTLGVTQVKDQVGVEEPLEIRLCNADSSLRQNISVTMRTPGNDEELAVGFLFTEGIVKSFTEIENINLPEENVIEVVLKKEARPDTAKLQRNFYMTSSCGVCGKTSIDAIKIDCAAVTSSASCKEDTIRALPEKLLVEQRGFESTGGLHASGLFDMNGNPRLIREDVGRHNALDKVIGAMIVAGEVPLKESILLVSGRASFELVQKAAVAQIPVMAAIGAPSSLAVSLANEMNMTLIGFLRDTRFTVYSGAERILV
jgi:FdhD protein